jgi:SAM-dependent methyltransferase
MIKIHIVNKNIMESLNHYSSLPRGDPESNHRPPVHIRPPVRRDFELSIVHNELFLKICENLKEPIINEQKSNFNYDNIPEIERNNVVDVYSKIHSDFSRTRYKPWPNVVNFINLFPEGSKMLEIGCGNGKNLQIRPNDIKGVDIVSEFVEECKSDGLDVIQADATKLPFDNNTFDATLSVAVLHHLSTIQRRLNAISEMLRVTKSGGKLLIEVWSIEDNDKADGPDTMVPWKCRIDDITYKRYYHFFQHDEIYDIINSIEGVTIETIFWEKYNWVLHCIKI